MQVPDRIHSMDNLRALAMLAGVVFHASLAYSLLMHPIWPPADTGRSAIVDAAAWFLHMFRMPLFFAIAGFFAALLVARRDMKGLFRNRCARVLLPLSLFLLPVLASMRWITMHAVATAAYPSPVLAWLRTYVEEHGALPSAPGWVHLWFLFYLMLFTVLVWVASTLELGRIGDRIAALPPAVLPMAMPLLLTPALACVSVPWPAPESFAPALWALAFFGMYFALGYQMFHRPAMLDHLQPRSSFLLAGAVAAYAALFWLSDGLTAIQPTPSRKFLHAMLEAYSGFWITLWCLLAARRWLDGRSATMRWIADSSYWVYIVHLPVLFAIQYPLLDLRMHWTAKFAISTVSTLALSFASYQLLVRYTLLGKLLNGRVPKAQRQEGPADTAQERGR
jgi:peptidoglycan/LPS O-acetylase OafA/YrhL